MNASRQHNYIHPLERLIAEHRGEFKSGTVHEVTVAHHSWCGVFNGRVCCCNPTLTLTDRTVSEPATSTGH